MKICPNCHSAMDDNTAFCSRCGAPLPAQGTPNNSYSQGSNQYQQSAYQQSAYQQPMQQPTGGDGNSSITPRSIPLCIILSFLTCGIYGIYWMIKMNDEVNMLSGEPMATNGGMVFLFTMISCGLYSFYWVYKMGERCDRIKQVSGSSSVLYLILLCVGLGIVDYCLIQDTINKAV